MSHRHMIRDIHYRNPSIPSMPQKSARKEFLQVLEDTAISVAQAQRENLVDNDTSSKGSPAADDTSSGSFSLMLITPPSPISPLDPDLHTESHSSISMDLSIE
ncbi:hypothetical protein BU15DRAFT_72249 [Melanogaster broomeanus]|nr:hypothetical protein BU15DRAFT_72249 [Melanogaster broomeanus]